MVFCVRKTVILLLVMVPLCERADARSFERNAIRRELSPDEVLVVSKTVEDWRDSVSARGAIDEYTDETLLADYKRFSRIISAMPSPGVRAVYMDIESVEDLGRYLETVFQKMPFSAFEKYGRLVGLMRDVLAIDLRYLRYLNKGVSGQEVLRLWRMHVKSVKEVDEEYLRYVVGIWDGAGGRSPGFEKQGYGTAKLPDGSVYKGQFKEGLFNGQGVLVKQNGYRYEGQFKDGFPHGSGVETLGDGTRYEGQFKDGRWHGTGTVVWKDGTRYTGQFRDGKLMRR